MSVGPGGRELLAELGARGEALQRYREAIDAYDAEAGIKDVYLSLGTATDASPRAKMPSTSLTLLV